MIVGWQEAFKTTSNVLFFLTQKMLVKDALVGSSEVSGNERKREKFVRKLTKSFLLSFEPSCALHVSTSSLTVS